MDHNSFSQGIHKNGISRWCNLDEFWKSEKVQTRLASHRVSIKNTEFCDGGILLNVGNLEIYKVTNWKYETLKT